MTIPWGVLFSKATRVRLRSQRPSSLMTGMKVGVDIDSDGMPSAHYSVHILDRNNTTSKYV